MPQSVVFEDIDGPSCAGYTDLLTLRSKHLLDFVPWQWTDADSQGHVLLARVDGEPAATMRMRVFEDSVHALTVFAVGDVSSIEGPTAILERACTSTKFRRVGLNRRLRLLLLKRARQRGAKTVLGMVEPLAPRVDMMHRMGYRFVPVYGHHPDDGTEHFILAVGSIDELLSAMANQPMSKPWRVCSLNPRDINARKLKRSGWVDGAEAAVLGIHDVRGTLAAWAVAHVHVDSVSNRPDYQPVDVRRGVLERLVVDREASHKDMIAALDRARIRWLLGQGVQRIFAINEPRRSSSLKALGFTAG